MVNKHNFKNVTCLVASPDSCGAPLVFSFLFLISRLGVKGFLHRVGVHYWIGPEEKELDEVNKYNTQYDIEGRTNL